MDAYQLHYAHKSLQYHAQGTDAPHRLDGRQRKHVRPRLLRPQRVLALPGGFLLRPQHTHRLSDLYKPPDSSSKKHLEQLQGPYAVLGTVPLKNTARQGQGADLRGKCVSLRSLLGLRLCYDAHALLARVLHC